MENRRQFYRHYFRERDKIPVQIQIASGGASIPGFITDMSVGGLAIQTEYHVKQMLDEDDAWKAEFSLPPANDRMTIPIEFVHSKNADKPIYGFRFGKDAAPANNAERERKIWSYLLDAQRQERRRWLGSDKSVG